MSRRYRWNRRIRVLKLLSGGEPKCACCGWSQFEGPNRLEFDHVNGGGGRLTKKRHSADIAFRILRGETGFRVLRRACNSVMVPGAQPCVLHRPKELEAEGSHPVSPRFTEPQQARRESRIDKPPLYVRAESFARGKPMPLRDKDMTTIQLSAATRDRLYRLKFRRTYDAFL